MKATVLLPKDVEHGERLKELVLQVYSLLRTYDVYVDKHGNFYAFDYIKGCMEKLSDTFIRYQIQTILNTTRTDAQICIDSIKWTVSKYQFIEGVNQYVVKS